MYVTPKSYFYDQIIRSATRLSEEDLQIVTKWDHAEIVWKVRIKGLNYQEMPQLKHLARFLTTPDTLIRKDSLIQTGEIVFGSEFHQYHPKTTIAPEIPESAKGWIVKPSDGFNGRGIKVFWNEETVQNYLVNDQSRKFIVQQYLHNPLLLNGKKFDIRLHVLITKDHIKLHKRGYLRVAPNKYRAKGVSRTVHLTNVAVHEDKQNLRPLSDLHAFNITFDDITKFVQQLKPLFEYAQKVEKKRCLSEDIQFNTFELLGLDILYDKNLKPWLLEINADPGVKSYGLYEEVAPQVIDDTLRETIFGGQTEFIDI